jgi:hypothetical protein
MSFRQLAGCLGNLGPFPGRSRDFSPPPKVALEPMPLSVIRCKEFLHG